MTERATLSELHEFANKVREAGGGNPIDALMPAVPQDPSQCLIARNLNFNCEVVCTDDGPWAMRLDTYATARRISEKLSLELVDIRVGTEPVWHIILPDKIGQVAADFDEAQETLCTIEDHLVGLAGPDIPTDEQRLIALKDLDVSEKDMKDLIDFIPYIESATEEAYKLASIINPDGSIVI